MRNGSALPDFFLFDKYKPEATVFPSPQAKGKWQILVTGEVPIYGKTSKILKILVEGNIGPPKYVTPLDFLDL